MATTGERLSDSKSCADVAGGAHLSAPSTRSALIDVSGAGKTYHTLDGTAVAALEPTHLSVREGEFLSIVGPSGCGKSTLLNLISGLIRPTAGRVIFDGRPLEGPTTDISLVFQRPVLLPWRSIISNIMLPVDVLGLRPRERYHRHALELMGLVGLEGFENAYPRELSGGMQQRASIVRALVYESRALLMDEPFAALDAMTREEMNIELLRIWKLTGRTIIFVTHNIAEAVLLSDRVVVMTARPGKIREVVEVPLERPRSLTLMGDPQFGSLVSHVRNLLHVGSSKREAA